MTLGHSRAVIGLYSGVEYHYRAKSEDAAGNEAVSADFAFTIPLPPNQVLPAVCPNPCNFEAGTTVRLSGIEAAIYTMSGKLVRKISGQPGVTAVEWDGKNEDGEQVIRGIYLYRITGADGNMTEGKIAISK